jgi:hypothetical protein
MSQQTREKKLDSKLRQGKGRRRKMAQKEGD